MKSKFFWHIAIIKRVKTVTFDQNLKKTHLVHGPPNILKASRSIIMSLILNSNSFEHFLKNKRKHAAP